MQIINDLIKKQDITIDLRDMYSPNPKQLEFHHAEETYKLFGGAMGGGKTASLINEGIHLNIKHPKNFGLLMRKTYPSFKNTVLPQLEKFMDPRLYSAWNKTDKLIYFRNGSRILYGGIGDDPDDWQKFMSGEYGWIALDQAEEFTEEEFKMLATRLRLRISKRPLDYKFLLSCNPNIGWIKERFIESNRPNHIFVPSLPSDNAENLPADYIDRMREILDTKQQRALLEGDWTAIGEPDCVYNYLEIEDSMRRRMKRTEEIDIGVDVARSGDDSTVICWREGQVSAVFFQRSGFDLMKSSGKVVTCIQRILSRKSTAEDDFYKKKDPIFFTVKIDADGLGAGVVDRLKELQEDLEFDLKREYGRLIEIKIVEIHGSGKARAPLRFKNLRAEIHFGFREVIPEISLPQDRELATQLMSIKYFVNSAGQIQIEPKSEIKKRLGRSPDVAEAFIYTFAQIGTDVGFDLI